MTKTRNSPKGDARRQKILDAAQKLFSEGGYHTASLADIAAEAGISQPGLLHHFPSKSDLLLAVLRDRDEQSWRLEGNSELTGIDYLNGYLHVLKRSEMNPALIQLNALISSESLSESHPAHEFFVESYGVRVKAVADAIVGLFDEDSLPDGVDRVTIARWLIALSDGMRYQLLLEGSDVHRSDTIAKFIETLRPYMLDQTTPVSADGSS